MSGDDSTRVNVDVPRANVNAPIFAFASMVISVGVMLVLIILDKADASILVTLLAANIPSFFAAMFAERTARDVRNGVVESKARDGAKSALHETGVSAVARQAVQSQPAVLDALTRLVSAMDDHDTRVVFGPAAQRAADIAHGTHKEGDEHT